MPDESKDTITPLPGEVVLMGSVMLGVTFGNRPWHAWGFNTIDDETFRTAAEFYRDGHLDHAVIEVFRLIESYLQITGLLAGVTNEKKPERVEKVINLLRDKGMLSDGDAFLLHGLRAYRNEMTHAPIPEVVTANAEALLLLSVPMVAHLEQVAGKVAIPRVIEWMEKLKNESNLSKTTGKDDMS